MVEIRRLRPLVKLAIPAKPQPTHTRRRSTFKRQERRRRDYPPPTPQPTPCVLWQGPVDRYGYGALKVKVDGVVKSYKAHRWIVEQARDIRLLPGEVILHLCDNPPCFAYAHLRIGTIAENNADMLAKGRASPPPVNVFYGEKNWNTKINAQQAADIVIARQDGVYVKDLAKTYGVSQSTIYNVLSQDRRAASDERQRERRAGRSLGSASDPSERAEDA